MLMLVVLQSLVPPLVLSLSLVLLLSLVLVLVLSRVLSLVLVLFRRSASEANAQRGKLRSTCG